MHFKRASAARCVLLPSPIPCAQHTPCSPTNTLHPTLLLALAPCLQAVEAQRLAQQQAAEIARLRSRLLGAESANQRLARSVAAAKERATAAESAQRSANARWEARVGALGKELSAAEAELARLRGQGNLVSESTQLNAAQRAVDAAQQRRARARTAYEHRRALAAHEARAAEDERRLAERTQLALDASAEAQRHVVAFSKERSAAVHAELGDARRAREEEAAATRSAQEKAAATERLAMRAMAASKVRVDVVVHNSIELCDAWQSEHDVCVVVAAAAAAIL